MLTREQEILKQIAECLKVPLSRFVPAKNGREPRMTRGIALGANRPGDGSTRYSIEYYSGVGTGCRDAGYFVGRGALIAFLRALRDGQSIQRFNREDRKRGAR